MNEPTPEQVRAFAAGVHADDRYGDDPYTVHLDAVVAILRDFGYDSDYLLSAGYLHDSIEDTDTTADDLRAFGVSEVVVLAVMFLTDAEGHNRKTRKANTYARVKAHRASGGEAVRIGTIVKWADRLANVRAAKASRPKLLRMYRKEDRDFRDAYTPRLMEPNLQRMIDEYTLTIR